jgi:transcriptional regulator with XRE-family HTH domain
MTATQTPFQRAVMEEKKFGETLKRLRTEAGLTQAELGELAGMRQGNIANLENGKRLPAWQTVMTLCIALQVNCDEFWTDKSPPPPPPDAEPGKRKRERKGE